MQEFLSKAVAIGVYYRSRGASLAIQNDAAKRRILAERRLGELLQDLHLRPGPKSIADEAAGINPALEDIRISEKESALYQKMARVPQDVLDDRFALADENGLEINTSFALRGPVKEAVKRAAALADAAEAAQRRPIDLGDPGTLARRLLNEWTRAKIDKLTAILKGGAAIDEGAEDDAA